MLQTFKKTGSAVWRIRIIFIRIQDLKKFVTDPDPGSKNIVKNPDPDRTLMHIQIQAKTFPTDPDCP